MAETKNSVTWQYGFLAVLILIWVGVFFAARAINPILNREGVGQKNNIATIEIAKNSPALPSHPGSTLLVSSPDFPEYKRLQNLSANSPEEFEQALATGICGLVPDGEQVEVFGKGDTPVWYQINFQGKGWWIMATFLKDHHGETWGVAEIVEQMSNDGG